MAAATAAAGRCWFDAAASGDWMVLVEDEEMECRGGIGVEKAVTARQCLLLLPWLLL